MRKISDTDKLAYYERNFFTMDGLWVIETENEVGWDRALEIDTAVWKRMLKTMFRRLKRYLKIETNTLDDIVNILTFRWSIENWDYELIKNDHKAVFKMKICPYKSSMERNEKRHDKIPDICQKMCTKIYKFAIEDFIPGIKVKRTKFLGLGDEYCDFILEISE